MLVKVLLQSFLTQVQRLRLCKVGEGDVCLHHEEKCIEVRAGVNRFQNDWTSFVFVVAFVAHFAKRVGQQFLMHIGARSLHVFVPLLSL